MRVALDNDRIILLCGDCLDYLPRIRANVHLVIADPPYYKITQENWDNQWLNAVDYIFWCKKWVDWCSSLMIDTASFYLWQQIGAKSQILIDVLFELREFFEFQDWITWQKSRGLGNRRGWLYTREECIWLTKTENYVWNEAAQYDLTKPTNRKDLGFNGQPRKSQFKRYTNIWECNEDQNYGANRIRNHYTPKPLVLIERIVNAHTLHSSNIVLDPFMGSGTTGEACVNLNRRFIGIEKDKEHFDFAVERIKNAIERRAKQRIHN